MNKLKKYREILASVYTKSKGYSNSSMDDKVFWSRIQEGFIAGYDAAIALELPI